MHKIIMVIISLFFSLALSILPLSGSMMFWNPAWCLLTLLFWNYHHPRWVNVGIAWCLGILIDGLYDSLFGLHAFSFALTVYLFDLFYRRFRMFPVLQQSLAIGLLVMINFFIVAGFDGIFADSVAVWPVLFSALTSALCWPLYLALGRKLNVLKTLRS